jgi:hypothetical protein
MKRIGLIIIALIIFSSHSRAQHKYYFPLGKPNDHVQLDTFSVKWYSGQLEALNEPVLYTSKSNNEIYRFTWLRSFAPAIVIRIEKDITGKYFIFWKEGSSSAGYPTNKDYKIVINKQRVITKQEWDLLQYRLKQLSFWNINTVDKSENGMDGAEWILEGKLFSKYHIVDRWSPKQGTDYYKCCDYLLSLTDIKIQADKKY